jgi:peptide/nickel transport system permease protein
MHIVKRRLLLVVPTLVGVSLVVFMLTLLTPGDPARAIAGPYASPEVVEAFRSEYHLDESPPVQYANWLVDTVRGNLGYSANLEQEIGPLVVSRLVNTFVLVGAALLLAIVFGVTLGLYAGSRPNSRVARLLLAVNVIAANVPPYLAGLLLVFVFTTTLGWLPSSGMYDPREPGGVGDLLQHLILPAVAVAALPMMVIARMTRAAILEVSGQEFVLFARAVGMPRRRVTVRYVLWNAMPPVVSVSGLQVGALLSGALFAEVVFSWPGLGEMLYRALSADDVLTIQAVTLFIALTFVTVNLLTDLIVACISPQSRAEA